MKRRHILRWGCAQCAVLPLAGFANTSDVGADSWQAPQRFARPDLASDEGGLWALMDREETKLRRSPFLLKDSELQNYVLDIACKLGAGHCQDIRTYLVRMPIFNASMAPNGMMQVWSGLLLRVENEAQLAAVIGHEIGHYLQRHSLERMRDFKGRTAAGLVLAMFGIVGLLGQLAVMAGGLAFSRSQERDADIIGLKLMADAGYDTREAAKIWRNLRAEAASNPGSEEATRSPMLATHPASDERAVELERWAESRSANGRVGQEQYRDRIANVQSLMLDDELSRSRFSESLVLMNRLIANQPERADLLFYRGEAHRLRAKSDDLDLALADFEAALDKGTVPPKLHRAKAEILKHKGDSEGAQKAYAKFLELQPDAPDAAMIRDYLKGTSS